MADLNLVFSRARYTGGPIDLVFGSTGAPTDPTPLTAHGTTVFGGISGSGLALYNNLNPRRVSASSRQPHQPGASAHHAPQMPSALPLRLLSGHEQPLQAGQAAAAEPRQPWTQAGRVRTERAQAHQVAAAIAAQAAQVHQAALQLRASAAQVHQVAAALQALAAQPHQVALLTNTGGAQAHQVAARLQALARQLRRVARFTNFAFVEPWQVARQVPPGKEVWPPVPTGPGFEPHVPDLNLVFACPAYAGGPVHLVFGHVCLAPVGPSAPLYILPARYYMAVHSLTARRLPDMQPVRIFGVTMRAGKGSYGWTFNVSATKAAFDQLAPSGGARAQLLIELDGLQFSGIVTNRMFDEAHGGRGCSITVHSRTALLANPMARETQRVGLFDRTAQQLALEALDLTGFALDWGLTDWLVQAGAWSHSGTPLGAVQTIVEAAGGYLQSHRTAATLLARHPYRDLPTVGGGLMPGAPWNWDHVDVIPDVELAPGVLTRIGVEEDEGPAVNGVYLQGTHWGDWALYKRAGTAADLLASPVTDALLTAEAAHRQRGRSIVGQAGIKQFHTCEMPVITSGASAPGILEDNQLIQINESTPWRGMVRDISVSAPVNGEVRQTFVIERHLASV